MIIMTIIIVFYYYSYSGMGDNPLIIIVKILYQSISNLRWMSVHLPAMLVFTTPESAGKTSDLEDIQRQTSSSLEEAAI